MPPAMMDALILDLANTVATVLTSDVAKVNLINKKNYILKIDFDKVVQAMLTVLIPSLIVK